MAISLFRPRSLFPRFDLDRSTFDLDRGFFDFGRMKLLSHSTLIVSLLSLRSILVALSSVMADASTFVAYHLVIVEASSSAASLFHPFLSFALRMQSNRCSSLCPPEIIRQCWNFDFGLASVFYFSMDYLSEAGFLNLSYSLNVEAWNFNCLFAAVHLPMRRQYMAIKWSRKCSGSFAMSSLDVYSLHCTTKCVLLLFSLCLTIRFKAFISCPGCARWY